MKIALYHPWIHLKGGGERCLIELVKRLPQHEWVIFTHYYSPKTTFSDFEKIKVVVLGKHMARSMLLRGLSKTTSIILTKINLSEFDLLVVSTGGIGEFITLRNHKIPTICFCYTPLRAAHDLYDFYKKQKGLLGKLFFILSVNIYRIIERAAWKNFDKVIAISENTKKRILNAKLKEPMLISIAYPGVDTNSFKSIGKSKNYFFAPSRITEYKRFELAINAFKEFKRLYKGKGKFSLLIAGHLNEKDRAYYNKLKKMADDKDIKIKIDISYATLKKLYAECYAVLFTPIDEDWGIVPLEGMASGKPVISVNEGGPKESILNGKTGFLIDATPTSFARKMVAIVEDKKKYARMCKAARKRWFF